MKSLSKIKVLKKSFEFVKKHIRSWYVKSPALTIAGILAAVVILCGTSYGAYSYVRHTQSTNTKLGVNQIDDVNEDNLKIDSELNTAKTKKDAAQSSQQDESQETQPHRGSDNNSSSENYSDRLVASSYSVYLGGANGVLGTTVDIRSASGKKITWLSVSAQTNTDFNAVSVYESQLSAGTDPLSSIRTLQISQTDPDASGSGTIRVSAGYNIEPVTIKIHWNPRPSYSVEKTGQTRDINGNVETHRFSFRLNPNAYFGTPNLKFDLYTTYGPAINKCGAGSVTSINTTYNGTKNFSLVCVHSVPSCTQPCPLPSAVTFKVGVAVQRSDGTYISGSGLSDLTYGVSAF